MSSETGKTSWDDFMQLVEQKMIENFGEVVCEHAKNPRNNQSLDDANGHVAHTGPCGDTIEIWVKVIDDTIEDIGFRSNGCDITQATGSMVTEMAKGMKVEEALKISQQDVINALIKLPEDHQHCALLARDALEKAIRDYQEHRDH